MRGAPGQTDDWNVLAVIRVGLVPADGAIRARAGERSRCRASWVRGMRSGEAGGGGCVLVAFMGLSLRGCPVL